MYTMRAGSARLVFTLLSAQFDVVPEGQAQYWVAPLSNFVSAYAQRDVELDRHPLRLRPTPVVPAGTPQAEKEDFESRNRKPLIRFDYEGAPGFIEPLPDHGARTESLRTGGQRNRLTAAMVGEVGDNPVKGLEELEGSIPAQAFCFAASIVTSACSPATGPRTFRRRIPTKRSGLADLYERSGGP